MRFKRFIRWKWLVAIFLATTVIYIVIPPRKPLFRMDYSTVVRDNHGKMLRAFLNSDEQWCFPPNSNDPIPDKLKTAVLTSEDEHFYQHPGVNPFAVARALYQNLTAGEVVSGASTITMQVARLANPKSRTYFHKFQEILQALKIELYYSKDAILQMYLTHAPYGGNIIGYKAASLAYFGKSPDELTWGQATILAVLPNAPGLVSPQADPQKLRVKQKRLLTKLLSDKIIDKETYDLALLEPIHGKVLPFPMEAPHFARTIEENPQLHGTTVRTTIDGQTQRMVKLLVQNHAHYLQSLGIKNAVALVAETQTGKVRAYVGSQDFFDNETQGQVDGVQASRSSGSLLKPFLYALSMDKGLILPQTLIKDVPTYYGAFSPHNADETYRGIVPAKQALIQSLNVPAVRLLYAYGIYPLYTFLQNAGVSTLFRKPDDYGLPLIIGGAEVTLWDMARLFRGLAREGQFAPLQILQRDSASKQQGAQQLISPGASYLTLNILKELHRPGSEFYWQQYQNQWPIAWKTGTSYGQRDGWAVGVSPQWTIAIWVGNFNGKGNANLSGARSAGPLLFDIFNALPKDASDVWFEKPTADLVQMKICSQTGFLAGPNCPETEKVDAPLFMETLKVCPYHKRIFETNDEKYQVCSLCWEPGNYTQVSRLVFPPDVVQYLREQGRNVDELPPHKPDCPGQSEQHPLAIVYPRQNAKLWVPRDFGGEKEQVMFRVAHRDKNRKIYWYLDKHYLGETQGKNRKPVDLASGWHTLEVIDEIGYSAKSRFYVGAQ